MTGKSPATVRLAAIASALRETTAMNQSEAGLIGEEAGTNAASRTAKPLVAANRPESSGE